MSGIDVAVGEQEMSVRRAKYLTVLPSSLFTPPANKSVPKHDSFLYNKIQQ